MYKVLLLILFSSTLNSVKAQVWIDSGAVWHYQSSSPWTKGYTKQEYSKDTVISGQLCQKIISESHSFLFDSSPNIYYEFPVSIGAPQYTYVSGDTVFYLADDGFRILCNFSAQVGDSWVGMTYLNNMGNADSLVVSVVEIGSISINNNYYRYVDLAADTCLNYGYGGRFVERFGFYHTHNYSGLSNFPYLHDCDMIVETFGSDLYCFNDASFQLNGMFGVACEYPEMNFLGVESKEHENFKLTPNPATIQVQVTGENIANKELMVFDFLGQLVTKILITSDNFNLSVEDFETGIYFLMIEEFQEVRKFVVE